MDRLELGVVERREHKQRATKRGLKAAGRMIIRCSSCLGGEENTN